MELVKYNCQSGGTNTKSGPLHGVQIIIISSCFYVSLFHAYLNKHMVSPAKPGLSKHE